MRLFGSKSKAAEAELESIRRWQAVIEFDLDGKILSANDLFLRTVGYELNEIVGQHHSIFVPVEERGTEKYRAFWRDLKAGEAFQAEFPRVTKTGQPIWLQATYTPICGRGGKTPFKVVKYATDITRAKLASTNAQGQLAAIDKSQATIEFDLAGKILTANQNFLTTLGYSLPEIQGRHHSMFVEPAERGADVYIRFWQKLARGEYDEGQYLRIGKDNRRAWIQASYNPIFDAHGKPYKVVKFATDITANKMAAAATEKAVADTREVILATQAKDLTKRISCDDKEGQIVELCQGINQLLDEFSTIIMSVGGAAEQINTGARRIGGDSQALAQRTEEQSSSLEETAATTEELAASVKQSYQRACEAAELGSQANKAAKQGGAIVTDAVAAMERIERAATDISEIIRVIDDIAFQTNLLALNAAVEAARAGDAGKGFAVVASEVRTLAQRSSAAANDIKKLITNSTEQVEDGVKLVRAAGAALSDIVESSSSVAAALSDITSASREQANGIEEVAKVVAHMDEMTQQNSSMAEESARVASDLQRATDHLDSMVSDFKVEGQRGKQPVISPDLASAAVAELRVVHSRMAENNRSMRTPAKDRKVVGGTGWEEF